MLVIFFLYLSYNCSGEIMKNNLKIFSITFDTKVKILIIICVIIAITIISYSFFYICVSSNKSQPKEIQSIENMLDVIAYEAKYSIVVNSNKTTNTYMICEDVDFENNIYNITVNNDLNISITSDSTKLQKNDMQYEYISQEISFKNPIAFSSIINCIKKISSDQIKGKITRVEQNDRYIYEITTEEEYIEKVKKIEICVLKENCKIFEIKLYNLDEKELYSIDFESFNVKK